MLDRDPSKVVKFWKVSWFGPVLVRLKDWFPVLKLAAPPLLFTPRSPVPPMVASLARMTCRSACACPAPLLIKAPAPQTPLLEIVITSPPRFCPFISSVAPASTVVPPAVLPKAAPLPVCNVPAREASEDAVVWVREWAEERGLDIGAE